MSESGQRLSEKIAEGIHARILAEEKTRAAGAAAALPTNPDAVRPEDGGDPGRRSLSDLGNGRRIVDREMNSIRYTSGMGWHVWNDEFWVPDADGIRVAELAKLLPAWVGAEAVATTDPDRQDALLKWAVKCRSLSTRKDAIKDAASDARIQVAVSQWDANPHLLGVKNGVIDLETGALRVGVRENYITKQVGVSYTPGLRATRWEEFLRQVTGGDKELERYLQLAAGYTLTGDRNHECLFLVYGPPGSGKSTFLDVIGKMLGSYKISFPADVLQDTGGGRGGGGVGPMEYYMAQLMGKRMLAINELPEMINVQEDAIKRLTGDSEAMGRPPGGKPVEFLAQAKLWIGTNHRPLIRDQAMWRRIRAIPFTSVPEKPDPGLKEYLTDPAGALPAALAWAVEGAVMLLSSSERQPLRAAASRVVADATAEYQASENKIGLFLDEETIESVGASVQAQDLFRLYQEWTASYGMRPMTLMSFVRKLQEQGTKLSGRGGRTVVHDRTVRPRIVSEVAGAGVWGEHVSRARS